MVDIMEITAERAAYAIKDENMMLFLVFPNIMRLLNNALYEDVTETKIKTAPAIKKLVSKLAELPFALVKRISAVIKIIPGIITLNCLTTARTQGRMIVVMPDRVGVDPATLALLPVS